MGVHQSRAARLSFVAVAAIGDALHRVSGAFCLLLPFVFLAGAVVLALADIPLRAGALAFFVWSSLCLLLFGICLALWLAGHAHRRRLDRDHQEFGMRLESVRDWSMRGDIDEQQYQDFRRLLEPLRTGRAPSTRLRQVGGQAGALALALLLATPALIGLGILAAEDCGDACQGTDVMGVTLATAAATLAMAVLGFVAAGLLLAVARQERLRHVAELDGATEGALARRRTTRSAATSPRRRFAKRAA